MHELAGHDQEPATAVTGQGALFKRYEGIIPAAAAATAAAAAAAAAAATTTTAAAAAVAAAARRAPITFLPLAFCSCDIKE